MAITDIGQTEHRLRGLLKITRDHVLETFEAHVRGDGARVVIAMDAAVGALRMMDDLLAEARDEVTAAFAEASRLRLVKERDAASKTAAARSIRVETTFRAMVDAAVIFVRYGQLARAGQFSEAARMGLPESVRRLWNEVGEPKAPGTSPAAAEVVVAGEDPRAELEALRATLAQWKITGRLMQTTLGNAMRARDEARTEASKLRTALTDLAFWARRFETEPQGVGLDAVEKRLAQYREIADGVLTRTATKADPVAWTDDGHGHHEALARGHRVTVDETHNGGVNVEVGPVRMTAPAAARMSTDVAKAVALGLAEHLGERE